MRLPKNRPPTHPGQLLLEDYLKPRGISQTDAAAAMEMPLNRLNEIIRGKRGVTADTALRLAKSLKTDPELWMNFQVAWDLWHAARAQRRAS